VCCVDPNCDDGKSCTTDSCATGTCANTVNHVACNDSNLCTDDSCDPTNGAADATSGCVNVDDDTNTCADTLVCNGDESCSGGSCSAGTPVDCSGMNDTCNVGVCVESGGSCTQMAIAPAPAGCKHDGDGCATGVECMTGNCVGLVCCADPSCDDGKSCTTDSCATGTCANTVNHAACSDSNPCTDDSCDPGNGAANATSGCVIANDDSNACGDGMACNGVETCSGGSCNAGTPVDCSGMSDACHVALCVETGGTCTVMPMDPFPSACLPDAGSNADAGADDAGVADAGPTPDAGSTPTPDAGEAGAGGTGGTGSVDRDAGSDAGADTNEDSDDGCDCSAPGGTTDHTPASPLVIGLALFWLARRRRTAQR